MGVNYNPKIVTDGLVLALDAANPKSYPGSGTNWFDLSGNGNYGVIQSTTNVTFSTDFGGVLQFDANITGSYITVNGPNLVSSNYTVIGASRYTGSERGRIISAKNNNWLLGHWRDNSEKYYANGWVTSSTEGANDTNWRIYAGTGNIALDQYYFWINDYIHTGPSTDGAAGPNGFMLGREDNTTDEFSEGQIGFLLAYNRVLTESEIKQNFNALRGRYGI